MPVSRPSNRSRGVDRCDHGGGASWLSMCEAPCPCSRAENATAGRKSVGSDQPRLPVMARLAWPGSSPERTHISEIAWVINAVTASGERFPVVMARLVRTTVMGQPPVPIFSHRSAGAAGWLTLGQRLRKDEGARTLPEAPVLPA